MVQLERLLHDIDELSSNELDVVYRHIIQRRQPTFWLIPGEHLKTIHEAMQPVYQQTAHMTDEEINTAIDEAISEVRSERKS